MWYRLLLSLLKWNAQYLLAFKQNFWILSLSIPEEAMDGSQPLVPSADTHIFGRFEPM
jgi:hypothetical protein